MNLPDCSLGIKAQHVPDGPAPHARIRAETPEEPVRDRYTYAGVMLLFCGASLELPSRGLAQGKSARDGVYTPAQATRGQTIYDRSCAECHGGNLRGFEYGPPLAGSEFVRVWGQKSLADLMDKIQPTMPANTPGSFTRAQVADVIAYMLQVGKFPPGSNELPDSEPVLQGIVIAK